MKLNFKESKGYLPIQSRLSFNLVQPSPDYCLKIFSSNFPLIKYSIKYHFSRSKSYDFSSEKKKKRNEDI